MWYNWRDGRIIGQGRLMPTSPLTYHQRLRAERGEPTSRVSNPKLLEARRLRSSARYRHKFRPWFLSQHPLCERCKASGCVRASEHCHHVRGLAEHPKDLCDESRCQALCSECHMRAEGQVRQTGIRDVKDVNERGNTPITTPLVGSNRGIVS